MRALLPMIFLFLAACEPQPRDNTAELPTQAQPTLAQTTVQLVAPNGTKIEVVAEVADDEPEREIGLMFRTELVSGTGMLFQFPQAQRLSFWMKNTLIPLDLLFFKQSEFVALVPWAKPHDESPLGPTEPADTVLEVPGGWAAANGVGAGWRLELPPAK